MANTAPMNKYSDSKPEPKKVIGTTKKKVKGKIVG